MSMQRRIILCTLLTAFLFGCLWIVVYYMTTSRPLPPLEDPGIAWPEGVSAGKICEDFSVNLIKAETTYKTGKPILFYGQINNASRDKNDKVYIIMNYRDGPLLTCKFSVENEKGLAQVDKNEWALFSGEIKGKVGNSITAENCSVVRPLKDMNKLLEYERKKIDREFYMKTHHIR